MLGTDTGIEPGHTFGSGEHVEMARCASYVYGADSDGRRLLQRPSGLRELMGLKDMGTLAVGKRADFIVLDANPLENILNTRKISNVRLESAPDLDQEARRRWVRKKADATQ